MSIEVANESGIDVSEEELISVAKFVIGKMDVNPAAELSMVLLDTAAMADLHVRWMDLPGPTDVMSFPMDELEPGGRPDSPEPGPSMLGDIVLCPEFAAKQATDAGHTLGQELALLTVHGVLHLLGYDHSEPDEEKEMFALQRELLEGWVADQVEAYHQERQTAKDRRLVDESRYFDVARDRDAANDDDVANDRDVAGGDNTARHGEGAHDGEGANDGLDLNDGDGR